MNLNKNYNRIKKLDGREKSRKYKIHNKGFAQKYWGITTKNEKERKTNS